MDDDDVDDDVDSSPTIITTPAAPTNAGLEIPTNATATKTNGNNN
jgi:hypothetical protein